MKAFRLRMPAVLGALIIAMPSVVAAQAQPFVVNGASDLLVEILGDAGKHARTAVSANELPFNIPVEIDMVVEVVP